MLPLKYHHDVRCHRCTLTIPAGTEIKYWRGTREFIIIDGERVSAPKKVDRVYCDAMCSNEDINR